MAKTTLGGEKAELFSAKLVSEFQSAFKELFGKNISETEAQQIGLRIAEFVFIKEACNRQQLQAQTL